MQLSYVDQSRDDLVADETVFEEVTQGNETIKVGPRELPARAYVSSFNFRGTDQQKLVGQLSGGERNRVLASGTSAWWRRFGRSCRYSQRHHGGGEELAA